MSRPDPDFYTIKRYIQFVKEGIGKPDEEFHTGEFVGDKTFVEEMKSKDSAGTDEIYLSLNELTALIAEKMEVPVEALFSQTRNRNYARVRGITGYAARKTLGISVTEIADYFDKDISAISKGITKAEKEITSDIDLQKAMYRIEMAGRKANEKKYANS